MATVSRLKRSWGSKVEFDTVDSFHKRPENLAVLVAHGNQETHLLKHTGQILRECEATGSFGVNFDTAQ